jgi:CO dehydrogenase/acetyl-CoA synthase alpha subunit
MADAWNLVSCEAGHGKHSLTNLIHVLVYQHRLFVCSGTVADAGDQYRNEAGMEHYLSQPGYSAGEENWTSQTQKVSHSREAAATPGDV